MSRVGKGTAGGLRILQDLGLYTTAFQILLVLLYSIYTYNKDIKPFRYYIQQVCAALKILNIKIRFIDILIKPTEQSRSAWLV